MSNPEGSPPPTFVAGPPAGYEWPGPSPETDSIDENVTVYVVEGPPRPTEAAGAEFDSPYDGAFKPTAPKIRPPSTHNTGQVPVPGFLKRGHRSVATSNAKHQDRLDRELVQGPGYEGPVNDMHVVVGAMRRMMGFDRPEGARPMNPLLRAAGVVGSVALAPTLLIHGVRATRTIPFRMWHNARNRGLPLPTRVDGSSYTKRLRQVDARRSAAAERSEPTDTEPRYADGFSPDPDFRGPAPARATRTPRGPAPAPPRPMAPERPAAAASAPSPERRRRPARTPLSDRLGSLATRGLNRAGAALEAVDRLEGRVTRAVREGLTPRRRRK